MKREKLKYDLLNADKLNCEILKYDLLTTEKGKSFEIEPRTHYM